MNMTFKQYCAELRRLEDARCAAWNAANPKTIFKAHPVYIVGGQARFHYDRGETPERVMADRDEEASDGAAEAAAS